MPWEITIVNGGNEQRKPLGTREQVIAAFADALPGVELRCPRIPPPEMLEMMPPIIREAALHPGLEAEFEVDDLSIQFHAIDQPILDWVNAEVRGNDDPRPALVALCASRGWSVISAADNSVVDLSAPDISAWEKFRQWRDAAFQSHRK